MCKCPPGFIGDPFTNCYKGSFFFKRCISHFSDFFRTIFQSKHLCQDLNVRPILNVLIINLASISVAKIRVRLEILAERRPNVTHRGTVQLVLVPMAGAEILRFSVINVRSLLKILSELWLFTIKFCSFAAECKADDDCPLNKACINNHCINPCGSTPCGRGAECEVQSHLPRCICPPGTQGDPFVSCITSVCQYNEDCADHEICDRLNRLCRPACQDDTCAETAICSAHNHQPVCTCPPTTTGNPYVECRGWLKFLS